MQDGASCCLLSENLLSLLSCSLYSMLVYKPIIKVLDVGEANQPKHHSSPSNGADAGGEDGGLSARHAAADGPFVGKTWLFWIRVHSGGSWPAQASRLGPCLAYLRRAS